MVDIHIIIIENLKIYRLHVLAGVKGGGQFFFHGILLIWFVFIIVQNRKFCNVNNNYIYGHNLGVCYNEFIRQMQRETK